MSEQAPETTTEETKAADAAVAQVAAEQVSPKAQKLKELGFENVTTDDEAFDRLAAAYTQTKNEFGAQLQQALEQLKATTQPTTAFQAEQLPPKQQEAANGGWWNPPQVDLALVSKYRTADGWKDGTPAEIRQQGDAYQNYLDRWAHDLVQRPHEVLPKLIRQEAERIVEERLGRTQQEQQLTQFQQRVFSENPWLFEPNPITSKPNPGVLSAEGKLIDQYMQEAQANGASYEFAWDYALTKHLAHKATVQAKQATTAQSASEINSEKKREFLNKASGTANRTGSMPTASETRASQRNQNMRPGQRFMQIAQREGLATN